MTAVIWLALAAALALLPLPSAVGLPVAGLARRGRLASGTTVGQRRLPRGRAPALPLALLWCMACAIAAGVFGGPALGVAAAVSAATLAGLVSSTLSRRRDERRRRHLLSVLRLLVAELEAGSRPSAALAAAAAVAPDHAAALTVAASAAAQGGDVAETLLRSGAADLVPLAHSWRVSTLSGAPMADVLARVADGLADDEHQQRAVASRWPARGPRARCSQACPWSASGSARRWARTRWLCCSARPRGGCCAASASCSTRQGCSGRSALSRRRSAHEWGRVMGVARCGVVPGAVSVPARRARTPAIRAAPGPAPVAAAARRRRDAGGVRRDPGTARRRGGRLRSQPGRGLPAGPASGAAGCVLSPVAVYLLARLAERPVRAPPDRALALTLDLTAAGLRGGQPVSSALTLAAPAAGPARAAELAQVAGLLRLGADPGEAWRSVADDDVLAPVAQAACRSADSGIRLARGLAQAADDVRAHVRAAAEARAHRAGVLAMAPLGLCFLPAFICLGVAPVVIGIARNVFGALP